MIEWLKYRRRLNRLNKKYEKEQKPYSKLISEAKGEEKESLLSEAGSMLAPIDDEIKCLKSSRLWQIADKLIVPLPDRQDITYWQFSYYTGGYYLTTEGMNEVRKRIRQEKKERYEGVIVWIAALTGIIGALTGLAAVLMR